MDGDWVSASLLTLVCTIPWSISSHFCLPRKISKLTYVLFSGILGISFKDLTLAIKLLFMWTLFFPSGNQFFFIRTTICMYLCSFWVFFPCLLLHPLWLSALMHIFGGRTIFTILHSHGRQKHVSHRSTSTMLSSFWRHSIFSECKIFPRNSEKENLILHVCIFLLWFYPLHVTKLNLLHRKKTPENNNDHHSTTFWQFMNHIYLQHGITIS